MRAPRWRRSRAGDDRGRQPRRDHELRAILGVLRDAEDVPLAPAPGIEALSELIQSTRERGVEVRLDVDGE
jgi:hypothetical protein